MKSNQPPSRQDRSLCSRLSWESLLVLSLPGSNAPMQTGHNIQNQIYNGHTSKRPSLDIVVEEPAILFASINNQLAATKTIFHRKSEFNILRNYSHFPMYLILQCASKNSSLQGIGRGSHHQLPAVTNQQHITTKLQWFWNLFCTWIFIMSSLTESNQQFEID